MSEEHDPLDAEFEELSNEDVPNMPVETNDERTAAQQMQELIDELRNPTLHEIQDPRHTKIINELDNIGHSNIADVFETQTILEYAGEDDEGEVIMEPRTRLAVTDIKLLPEEIQKTIKKIKITRKPTGDVIEVEMYDKLVALEKLMRHHGLYEQDNDQKSKSMADNLLDVMFNSAESQGMPVPVRDIDD